MFSKCFSAFTDGMAAVPAVVEADVGNGLPSFEMVGLLSSEVREARERVRIALKNSGYFFPPKKITINISPAGLRKEGNFFDLPIALAVLCAFGHIKPESFAQTLIVGELSLEGTIKRVDGILPLVCMAKASGFKRCIVPMENVNEACVIDGIEVYGVCGLLEAAGFMNEEIEILPAKPEISERFEETRDKYGDLSDIRGQKNVIRGISIAVCGMHNVIMLGPPGCGKSMIARRIPSIMPGLTFEESIEISEVYSVAGLLDSERFLITQRPFRAPHHTVTATALTGGGSNPKPGEVSLANHGILFLDELAEYNPAVIEVLREPLEEKKVTISRLKGTYTFPANFMLVGALNPCKCGYYPDRNRCSCSQREIKRYLGRLSRPVTDRIDIFLTTKPVGIDELVSNRSGIDEQSPKPAGIEKSSRREPDDISSEKLREITEEVLSVQKKRFEYEGISYNSQMTPSMIEKYAVPDEKGQLILKKAFEKYGFSARAYHKIIKVARTIADMDGSSLIKEMHILEALSYHSMNAMGVEI